MDTLRQKETGQISEISDVIQNLELRIKEIELFINVCGEKVRKGGLDLIEYSKVTPPTSDTCLPAGLNCIPIFAPDQDLLSSITKLVGEIELGVIEINLTRQTNPGTTDIVTSVRIKPGDIKIKNFGSFRTRGVGKSVVPAGKDTAWMADFGNTTLHMYDTEGRHITSVTVTEQGGILDLAVRQQGGVIVCNDDNKVRILTKNGVIRILIDTEPYCPQGVCLSEKGEIAVCMGGRGDENHVVIYSPNGKHKVREIAVKDDQGNQLLINPHGVVITGEYISVMNLDSNVVTFDMVGKVRWVYDGSRTEQVKFCPKGMSRDKFCNLLITDSGNHAIHYVDREGGLIQILRTKDGYGIFNPWGIGVDSETGTAWVGGGSNTVRVFRLSYNVTSVIG